MYDYLFKYVIGYKIQLISVCVFLPWQTNRIRKISGHKTDYLIIMALSYIT